MFVPKPGKRTNKGLLGFRSRSMAKACVLNHSDLVEHFVNVNKQCMGTKRLGHPAPVHCEFINEA